MLEHEIPDLLKYYEDRRTGKIEEQSFERRDPIYPEKARMLYYIEHGQIYRSFFAVDYNHGFTGRGGELAPYALDV